VKNVHDLDREVIKGDNMNTDVVCEILQEMNCADIPRPDYDKIQNSLFANKRNYNGFKIGSRRLATAASVVFALMLFTTTVFAARLLYEWITVREVVHVEQMMPFDNIEQAESHIGIGLNIPTVFPEGFYISLIQDTAFGSFRTLLIMLQRDIEFLTLTVLYEFADLSDVNFFVPHNIMDNANMVINDVPVVHMHHDTFASAFWQVDGIIYMLSGSYTFDELVKILNSIP